MKNLILVLCVLAGGAWWCYSILDLMFFHTLFGLIGIGAGSAMFMLGLGEINEMKQ